MKKILLFTALLSTCAFTLNADLLNGPWSPESQELVKLINDKNLPIPEILKANESDVRFFLENVNGYFGGTTNEEITKKMTALINDNAYILDACIKNNIKDQEYIYNKLISLLKLSLKLENVSLYKKILASLNDTPEKTIEWVNYELKRALLYYVSEKKNNNIYVDLLIEHVRAFPQLYMLNNQFGLQLALELRDLRLADLAIQAGFNINNVNGENKTVLEYLQSAIDAKNKPFTPEQVDFIKQKFIPYLKSKGAKTYAELTAQKKGSDSLLL